MASRPFSVPATALTGWPFTKKMSPAYEAYLLVIFNVPVFLFSPTIWRISGRPMKLISPFN